MGLCEQELSSIPNLPAYGESAPSRLANLFFAVINIQMSSSCLQDVATQTWVAVATEVDPSVPLKNGSFTPTNANAVSTPVLGMTATGSAMGTIIKMGSGDIGAGTRLLGVGCGAGVITFSIANTANVQDTWTDYGNAKISYMVLKYA
jgi:hypothetical protein